MDKKELLNEINEVDEDTEIRYWILDNLISDEELKHYVEVLR